MQPRQRRDTLMPADPRFTYCILHVYRGNGAAGTVAGVPRLLRRARRKIQASDQVTRVVPDTNVVVSANSTTTALTLLSFLVLAGPAEPRVSEIIPREYERVRNYPPAEV